MSNSTKGNKGTGDEEKKNSNGEISDDVEENIEAEEPESEDVKEYKRMSKEMESSDFQEDVNKRDLVEPSVVFKVTDAMMWLKKRKGYFKEEIKPQTEEEKEKEISAVRHIQDLWNELTKTDYFLNTVKSHQEEELLVDNVMMAVANADDPYCKQYVESENILRKKAQEYKKKDRQR